MSDKTPPALRKATHESVLSVGEKKLACAVLEDGTRIISKGAIFRAFERTKRGRAKTDPTRVPGMPSFADAKSLKPFIDTELPGVLLPITYLNKKGNPFRAIRLRLCPRFAAFIRGLLLLVC